jgi:hypothetical protein
MPAADLLQLIKRHAQLVQRQGVEAPNDLRALRAGALGVAVAPRHVDVLGQARLVDQRLAIAVVQGA